MAASVPHLRLVPDARPTPRRRRRPVEPLWRQVLGRRLRRLRPERQETLAETARRAGVSPQYLSEVERGSKDASSEMLAAIAGALEVTLIDLTAAIAADLTAARGVRGSRGVQAVAPRGSQLAAA